MGSLGAAAPKPVFAYFCLAAKVGRARGHEISPGRGVPETHRIRGTKSPLTRVCQKHPVPGARNLPRQGPPKRQWRDGFALCPAGIYEKMLPSHRPWDESIERSILRGATQFHCAAVKKGRSLPGPRCAGGAGRGVSARARGLSFPGPPAPLPAAAVLSAWRVGRVLLSGHGAINLILYVFYRQMSRLAAFYFSIRFLLLTIFRQSRSPRSIPRTSISAVATLEAKGMLF